MSTEKTIEQIAKRINNIRNSLERDGHDPTDIAQAIFLEAMKITHEEWDFDQEQTVKAVRDVFHDFFNAPDIVIDDTLKGVEH